MEKLTEKLAEFCENIKFENLPKDVVERTKLLILDTVGILSRCYQYAEIAYVGGAMGSTGLHNILEPASEGIPIIIGKNYSKFDEALN